MNLDWTAMDAPVKFKGTMIMVALATTALHSLCFITIFLLWGHFEDIIKVSFLAYEGAGNDTILCSYNSISFS